MKKIIQISLILFTVVYSERANKNRVGQNDALNNWSYIGPIKSEDHYKQILNQVLENGLVSDSTYVLGENIYKIIDASASSGYNNVHQLYPNLEEDDYLICVSEVLSNNETEVAIQGQLAGIDL